MTFTRVNLHFNDVQLRVASAVGATGAKAIGNRPNYNSQVMGRGSRGS